MAIETYPPVWLVPLSGPPLAPIEVVASPAGATLGRHEHCDVRLPAAGQQVSRMHARIARSPAGWRIIDLGSRGGTYVNGCRVPTDADMPLREGDVLRIAPWTLLVSAQPRRRAAETVDETGAMLVRTATQAPRSGDELVALLLEAAAALQTATSEQELADALIDSACRATHLPNAAVLRPIDDAGNVEIVAKRGGGERFSRSLIRAASAGQVAELSANVEASMSHSIMQMSISAALCVPLVLGSAAVDAATVALYLYLDARGARGGALPPAAGACAAALGRLAGLALSNLKRVQLERDRERLQTELESAEMIRQLILPPQRATLGRFACIGRSRGGRNLSGDFYDLIELSPTRLAVAVGDVTGKGIAASVLMTATQGFVHAELERHGDPALAASNVNRFISSRAGHDRFVTLWLGVFDAEAGVLRYVDAGHGLALVRRGAAIERLGELGGLPIGVDAAGGYQHAEAPFPPGSAAIIVSDGITEQFGLVPDGDAVRREQFHVDRVAESLAASLEDPVQHLFRAVARHAGTEQLSDDATAVCIRL